MHRKKILFIEFHVETNTFSPLPTDFVDFEKVLLAYEEKDIMAFHKKYKGQYLGFKRALRKYGGDEFEAVPVYSAWGNPQGEVTRAVFDHFVDYALDKIKKCSDLSGIYLSLHGATVVEGIIDCESYFMEKIRDIVGNDFPLALSFDLHANVTPRNVELATFIIGYKTNPHRDRHHTGFKTTRLLIDTIRGKIRPVSVIQKMRMIKGCGVNVDFLAPTRKLFWMAYRYGKQEGLLDASPFMLHLWLDTEDIGWSVVVTADGEENKPKALEYAEKMAEHCWKTRAYPMPKFHEVYASINKAKRMVLRRKFGAIYFCDTSDAVPAGALGESTWLLKALVEKAPELTSYVPVMDVSVVHSLWDKAVGDVVDISVGGKLDKVTNRPFDYHGKIICIKQCRFYKVVVVKSRGVHLILTDNGFPGFYPEMFREIGLPILKADIIVVKNLYPFRIFHAPYIRKVFNIVSQGVTNLDVHALNYTKINRPVYPLDDISDWRW